MSSENKIFMSEDDDQEMSTANKNARETFKYFWRELYWERRRIIPGLEIASVKIIFTDSDLRDDEPSVEHMWITDIDFDGDCITGFLMNKPNWLRNISEGDHVKAKLTDVSDWMFAIEGRVYGGFTINLLRSRMSRAELNSHDQAWGLNFGNPNQIDLVYVKMKKGILAKIIGSDGHVDSAEEQQALIEHPMSSNMAQSLIDELKKSDDLIHSIDENGWTTLHEEALAGNATSVKILLDHGADRNLKNKRGETPLDLAKVLNWKNVIEALS